MTIKIKINFLHCYYIYLLVSWLVMSKGCLSISCSFKVSHMTLKLDVIKILQNCAETTKAGDK